MWKSQKFILAAVLAAVMVIGSTAGVVLAQDEEQNPASQGPRDALTTRVAEILGISQQTLKDAFKQAISESRPENPPQQGRRDALTARVAEKLGIDQQELENATKEAITELREEALDNRLQKLVDEDIWTQDQADAYKAWLEARPDVPRLGPRSLSPNQPGNWRPEGPGRFQGKFGPTDITPSP
ncbi:MAG: hypothetical protein H8D32_04120 [Dehalococcoidia bacterium]|nr:hypothetical protein [Dehalococcoidia bacterium]